MMEGPAAMGLCATCPGLPGTRLAGPTAAGRHPAAGTWPAPWPAGSCSAPAPCTACPAPGPPQPGPPGAQSCAGMCGAPRPEQSKQGGQEAMEARLSRRGRCGRCRSPPGAQSCAGACGAPHPAHSQQSDLHTGRAVQCYREAGHSEVLQTRRRSRAWSGGPGQHVHASKGARLRWDARGALSQACR